MMDIKNIGELLKRYQNLIGAHQSDISTIIEVIHQNTGVNLSKEQITFKKGEIKLKLSPGEKQQLFLHNAAVLKLLNEQGITAHSIG